MKPEVKNEMTKSTKPTEHKPGRDYTSKESEESEKEYESDKDAASNEGMPKSPDYKHQSNDPNILSKEKVKPHSDGYGVKGNA